MLESRVGTEAPPSLREKQTIESEIRKLKNGIKGSKDMP